MSIITVDIKSIRLNFHIELSSRVSFMIGDSATGKTTFYSMLYHALCKEDEVYVLNKNIDIIFYTYNDDIKWDICRDMLIIVTDDFVLEDDEVFKELYNSAEEKNLYFLILSREEVFYIQNDVRYYKMVNDSGNYTLKELEER